ncbi:MAG: chromate transporter [Mobilitalea sp.]
MIYIKLLISFLQIGLFSIGGGYAALPLIQEQVVDTNKWLTRAEFTDLITISPMTPGPIAISSAIFVGNRVAGFSGSMIAVFGCILPSFLIVLLLAHLYYKYKNLTTLQGVLGGISPAVVALIASAGMSILITTLWGGEKLNYHLSEIDYVAATLFLLSFIVIRKFKINPVWIMLGSGFISVIFFYFIG